MDKEFTTSAKFRPCRLDQLFAASTKVIDLARKASQPFESDENRKEALSDLLAAVKVFDRLNGAI